MTTATVATSTADAGTDCLFHDVAFLPDVAGHFWRIPAASAGDCQGKCARTEDCADFAFWEPSGSCVLMAGAASWSPAVGVVSGPAVCVTKLRIVARCVDAAALLASTENGNLSARVASDLADAAGLRPERVRDLEGRRATVSLAAGASPEGNRSLVASAYIDLPPGWTTANVSGHLGSPATREDVAASVDEAVAATANATDASTSDRANCTVNISVEPHIECFLSGFMYEIPNSTDDANDTTITAPSAADCQAKCMLLWGCEHFSFREGPEGPGMCSLLNSSAVLVRDAGATSGPRTCMPPSGGALPTTTTTPTAAANATASAPTLEGVEETLEGWEGWLMSTWRGLFSSDLLIFYFAAIGCAIAMLVLFGCLMRRTRRLTDNRYQLVSIEEGEEEGAAERYEGCWNEGAYVEDHHPQRDGGADYEGLGGVGGNYDCHRLERAHSHSYPPPSMPPPAFTSFLGTEALQYRHVTVLHPDRPGRRPPAGGPLPGWPAGEGGGL